MFDHERYLGELQMAANLRAADSVKDIPADVQVLHVTKKTKALERLAALPALRVPSAHDIDDADFRLVCRASQVTHLTANAFRLHNFDSLAGLAKLEALELTDNTKVDSLGGLESLTRLQLLVLANCPVTVSLEPIASCSDLRYLWLSSRYAKPMRVPTLDPLSNLKKLERLRVTNVRVQDKRLDALRGLRKLVEIKLPNFFPQEEFVALAAAHPFAESNLRKWTEKPQPAGRGR
jgi:hypothetical protein